MRERERERLREASVFVAAHAQSATKNYLASGAQRNKEGFFRGRKKIFLARSKLFAKLVARKLLF